MKKLLIVVVIIVSVLAIAQVQIGSNVKVGGSSGTINSGTTDGVAYYSGATTLDSTSAGTAGQVLTSNGAGVAPTYQSTTYSGVNSYEMLPWRGADNNSVGGFGVGSNNEVRWMRVYLPAAITINKVAWSMASCAGSGSESVGIYSADGTTRLLTTGAQSCAGTQAITLGAPVTIGPGFVIYAWTSTITTDTFYSVATTAAGILNFGSNAQIGTAATASSAGALPSSLGVLSGSSIASLVCKLQG